MISQDLKIFHIFKDIFALDDRIKRISWIQHKNETDGVDFQESRINGYRTSDGLEEEYGMNIDDIISIKENISSLLKIISAEDFLYFGKHKKVIVKRNGIVISKSKNKEKHFLWKKFDENDDCDD